MSPSTQHAFEPEEVMAYLDGELEPQRAAALASHLDHCADCQAIAATMRRVSNRLVAWEVESASASLVKKVTNAANEQSRAQTSETKKTPRQIFPAREWLRARPWAWGVAGGLAVSVLWMATGYHSTRKYEEIASQRGATLGYLTDATRSVARQITPGSPAPAPPSQTGIVGSSMAKLQGDDASAESSVSIDGQLDTDQLPANAQAPMIARTASLSIIVKDFDPVEAAVKGITGRHHGYLGDLTTSSPQNAAHSLTATLRIPAPQLEAALAELKQLGRVDGESESGEEVTKQYTDLTARLKNSQETEQRLLNVLRNNTGKVKDILEAEAQIERVRGQIEEMQADQRALKTRVDFATVQLSMTEDFRASLEVAPPSTSSRLHNAVVDGYHAVVESLIGFAVWLLSTAPILLLWAALLFFPARWAWKRWLRPRFAKQSAA